MQKSEDAQGRIQQGKSQAEIVERIVQRAVDCVLHKHEQLQGNPMADCLKHSTRVQKDQVPSVPLLILPCEVQQRISATTSSQCIMHQWRCSVNLLAFSMQSIQRNVYNIRFHGQCRGLSVIQCCAMQAMHKHSAVARAPMHSVAQQRHAETCHDSLEQCIMPRQSKLEKEQAAWRAAAARQAQQNRPNPSCD